MWVKLSDEREARGKNLMKISMDLRKNPLYEIRVLLYLDG